jgi:hypothetical protein
MRWHRSSADLPRRARRGRAGASSSALARSRTKHAGRPETLRFREPELKVCNSGIVWNGTRLFLRRAEDMHGQPREREVCEINASTGTPTRPRAT